MGIECGRCDSNAQAARFELARYAKFPSLPQVQTTPTRQPVDVRHPAAPLPG
jgi:hypothetical protein